MTGDLPALNGVALFLLVNNALDGSCSTNSDGSSTTDHGDFPERTRLPHLGDEFERVDLRDEGLDCSENRFTSCKVAIGIVVSDPASFKTSNRSLTRL